MLLLHSSKLLGCCTGQEAAAPRGCWGAMDRPQCWQHALAAAVALGLVATAAGALPEDALFVPGTLPLDTDGKEV